MFINTHTHTHTHTHVCVCVCVQYIYKYVHVYVCVCVCVCAYIYAHTHTPTPIPPVPHTHTHTHTHTGPSTECKVPGAAGDNVQEINLKWNEVFFVFIFFFEEKNSVVRWEIMRGTMSKRSISSGMRFFFVFCLCFAFFE